MPCGATCGANQDIDCKLTNGQPCTHANQCMGGACTTFFRDMDGDGFGGAPTQVCGTTPPSGHIAVGRRLLRQRRPRASRSDDLLHTDEQLRKLRLQLQQD